MLQSCIIFVMSCVYEGVICIVCNCNLEMSFYDLRGKKFYMSSGSSPDISSYVHAGLVFSFVERIEPICKIFGSYIFMLISSIKSLTMDDSSYFSHLHEL